MANDLTSGASSFVAGLINSAQSQASAQDQNNLTSQQDWRVKLALAPGSNYLYNAGNPGILRPLRSTDGVIFPYTPQISVSYAANYDASSPTHSNYKIYQYASSNVDQVTITGDFTCQDTSEAEYLLAVIHFFKSMTKMFYGQDTNPKNGTPPPLCYMTGMGGYQFSQHPLAITGFTYNLPNDCDYIRTTVSAAPTPSTPLNMSGPSASRLSTLIDIVFGGFARPAQFSSAFNAGTFTTAFNSGEITWVPTKIQLSISCLPIMSRNAVSNQFSLTQYANGSLLRGSQNKSTGMW